MRITDLITDTILQLLCENDGTIQIQRNDMANQIGCVPSQINYVITSRFTKEQGYIVESRRGGGGFIKIVKVNQSYDDLILNLINELEDELDESTTRILIKSIYNDNYIDEMTAKIMLSVIADNNFRGLDDNVKRKIRANLFKTMLINSIK
ncbi:MAG: CtsR family transcriptional regulator [Oscillospiraceae bacterium]